MALRPAAGPRLAGGGRHGTLQRGGQAAEIPGRGRAGRGRSRPAAGPRQGRRLPAGVGGAPLSMGAESQLQIGTMQNLKSRSWEWRFDQPPDRVWPVVADTARFNEAAKLPKYQVEDVPGEDGHVLRLARAKVGGFPLEWEERPYQWVQNRSFRSERCRT